MAPELCRVVYEIICTGERDLLLRWVRFVRSVAEEKGLAFESEQAWREADLARHAADGMDSRTFWERS